MYDVLVKRLRKYTMGWVAYKLDADFASAVQKAADALEELSAKVDSLQTFADNISRLPDCNTCSKKGMCEFLPKYGNYCRINCPHWLGEPQKED